MLYLLRDVLAIGSPTFGIADSRIANYLEKIGNKKHFGGTVPSTSN
jgi:hypothetical protein